MEEQMISVGKILKPHGLKGDLKVLLLTDHPEQRFLAGNKLFVETSDSVRKYTVERSKHFKQNMILLKLVNIDSGDDAEGLSGTYLTIPENEIAPLESGRFYIFQIIGLNVYEETGEYLGKVLEVRQTGGNDIYIIQDNHEQELLIPALKEVVKKVDVDNKTMVVSLLPGLR